MAQTAFVLNRDTPSTLIPAGDAIVLPQGTEVEVSQALGGSVTVRSRGMLYRIAPGDVDALGPEWQEARQAGESGDAASGSADAPAADGPPEEARVWEALKTCYDPEIPINIVDLGLIYDLRLTPVDDAGVAVGVKMTLTAQGCGMGPVIADDARQKIEALPGVTAATVDVVWDPPWSPHMISPEGRLKLGLE